MCTREACAFDFITSIWNLLTGFFKYCVSLRKFIRRTPPLTPFTNGVLICHVYQHTNSFFDKEGRLLKQNSKHQNCQFWSYIQCSFIFFPTKFDTNYTKHQTNILFLYRGTRCQKETYKWNKQIYCCASYNEYMEIYHFLKWSQFGYNNF